MRNILKIQFNPIAVYIHVGDSNEGKVYLSVFMKVSGGGRSFNIKVTQLEDNLAPNNCLQYFPEAEGLIKSFNYDTDGSIVDNREATYFVRFMILYIIHFNLFLLI